MTTPWSDEYKANAQAPVKTAISVKLERSSSVAPKGFCCGSNTISDSKDPAPLFSVSPVDGWTDTVFEFDASESRSPDSAIVAWSWDFGDGQTASGETATHQFPIPDNYEVTLTVEDALGNEAEAIKVVVVKDMGLPPLPLWAGSEVWVGGTGRAWYTRELGSNDDRVPVWTEQTTGLPADARVNDIRVNPQTPSKVYAACGDPAHAVDGGLRQRTAWETGEWTDVTPPKPDQWRDPEWVGTEATRFSATLIALSDAEWNAANWIAVRPSFKYDGNLLAICQVKKSGADAYGTFACYYRSTKEGGEWEIEQLWLNDTQPWFCKPLQVAVCLSSCRYVYVTLEGQDPASNDYKLAFNVDYGRSGAWSTSQLTVGASTYKPAGAIWAEHDWKIYDSTEDEYTFSDTRRAQAAITEDPWILEGTVDVNQAITEYDVAPDGEWKLRSSETYEKVAQSFQVSGADAYISCAKLKLKHKHVVGEVASGKVWVEIQTDDGGDPSGEAVANGVSEKVTASDIDDSEYEWITFSFGLAAHLEASTIYHLVLKGNYDIDEDNHVAWGKNSAAGYGSGTPATYDSDEETWNAQAGDNVFSLYHLMITWESAPLNTYYTYLGRYLGNQAPVCYVNERPVEKGWYAWEDDSEGAGTKRNTFRRWLHFPGPDNDAPGHIATMRPPPRVQPKYNWVASDARTESYGWVQYLYGIEFRRAWFNTHDCFLGAFPVSGTEETCTAMQMVLHRLRLLVAFDSEHRLGLQIDQDTGEDEENKTGHFYDKTGNLPETIYSLGLNHFEV